MLIFEVWLMKLKCLKLLNLLCIIIQKKILILQPNRVVYFRSFYYETPCTTGHHPKIFTTFLQNSQSGQKVGLFFCQQYEKSMEDKWKTSIFFSQAKFAQLRIFIVERFPSLRNVISKKNLEIKISETNILYVASTFKTDFFL